MATRDDESFSLPAGADLSLKEGSFGKLSGSSIIACSTLGERADVVIGNAPLSGAIVDCFPRAGKKVAIKVGAVAVAAGAELTPDANGLAITAVSTNIVHAKALVAGAAGATIECLWVDAYAKP
jgi:hypothetical protein